MVKLLVLKAWYDLSDLELERQVDDRLFFRHFLGYPELAPDYSMVWQFRERSAETDEDSLLWAELQRQLDAKSLMVRKGVV
jgi:IS5 family transposase